MVQMTLLQRAKYSVHLRGLIVREVLAKVLRAIRRGDTFKPTDYEYKVKRAIERASRDMFCSRRNKTTGKNNGIRPDFIKESLLGINANNKRIGDLKTGAYDKVYFAFAQRDVGKKTKIDLAALVYHKQLTKTKPWAILDGGTLISRAGNKPPETPYHMKFIAGHKFNELNQLMADDRVAEIEIVCRNAAPFAKGAAATLMSYVLAKLSTYKKQGQPRFKAVVVSLVSMISKGDVNKAHKYNDFGQQLAFNRGTTPLKKIVETFGFKQVSAHYLPATSGGEKNPFVMSGISYAVLMDTGSKTWARQLEEKLIFQENATNNSEALHTLCQVKQRMGRSYCV
jgi:hypothetical protein